MGFSTNAYDRIVRIKFNGKILSQAMDMCFLFVTLNIPAWQLFLKSFHEKKVNTEILNKNILILIESPQMKDILNMITDDVETILITIFYKTYDTCDEPILIRQQSFDFCWMWVSLRIIFRRQTSSSLCKNISFFR